MPNYGDPEYWNKRYKDQANTVFDWLEDYKSLKDILKEFCHKESRVLVLGCGNAEFSEEMYDDGFKHIYNIDISDVVIQQMRKRNGERDLMTYEVMDVRKLEYKDDYFDVAIDKSTIDALLCGDDAFLNVALMMSEVQRVLKTDGVYMAISYGRPENRIFHFERPNLDFAAKQFVLYPADCATEEEKTDKSHFVYLCTKGSKAKENHEHYWESVHEQLEKEAKEERLLDDEKGGEESESAGQ